MDYRYIEQLMERYWNAETSQEEESILRTFFSQKNIPADMEHLRPLFSDEASSQTLGDDFDARMLAMIGEASPAAADRTAAADGTVVRAKRVTMAERLMPLFRAAAVIAIVLTIGGALQAPWDNTWNTPEDYAALQQNADTIAAVQPIQAENISDAALDSTKATTGIKAAKD